MFREIDNFSQSREYILTIITIWIVLAITTIILSIIFEYLNNNIFIQTFQFVDEDNYITINRRNDFNHIYYNITFDYLNIRLEIIIQYLY